jgi:hypothetical protein
MTLRELPSNIFEVGEDESAADVKATSNDIFGILTGKTPGLVELQIFPHELLVVCELNDKRNLECILQAFGEHEGDEVS